MAIPRFNKCTIWTKGGRDPVNGRETLGIARSYKCEVKRGSSSKSVDKTGEEFYPSSTFWVRESDLISGTHSEPTDGEMIAQGDHTDVDNAVNAGAEVVRSVVIHNHAKFGEKDSYTIGTKA